MGKVNKPAILETPEKGRSISVLVLVGLSPEVETAKVLATAYKSRVFLKEEREEKNIF